MVDKKTINILCGENIFLGKSDIYRVRKNLRQIIYVFEKESDIYYVEIYARKILKIISGFAKFSEKLRYVLISKAINKEFVWIKEYLHIFSSIY